MQDNLPDPRSAALATCIYSQVKAAIQNLILGSVYIEHVGVYQVRNHTTGLTGVVELCKPRLMTLSAKARRDGLHQVRAMARMCAGWQRP